MMPFFFSEGIWGKVIAEDSNKQVAKQQHLPQRFVTLQERG